MDCRGKRKIFWCFHQKKSANFVVKDLGHNYFSWFTKPRSISSIVNFAAWESKVPSHLSKWLLQGIFVGLVWLVWYKWYAGRHLGENHSTCIFRSSTDLTKTVPPSRSGRCAVSWLRREHRKRQAKCFKTSSTLGKLWDLTVGKQKSRILQYVHLFSSVSVSFSFHSVVNISCAIELATNSVSSAILEYFVCSHRWPLTKTTSFIAVMSQLKSLPSEGCH